MRYKVLQHQAKASFPITSSERIETTLLVICQLIKNVEIEDLNSALVHFSSENKDNNIFLNQMSSDESSNESLALSDNNTESNNKEN